MTVAVQTKSVSNPGNGSTFTFSFSPMVIFSSADLEVITTVIATGVETTRTEGTGDDNWSLSLTTFPATGSIVYPADQGTALTSATRITVRRVLTLEQEVDLNNQGGYHADVQEQMHDRAIMIDIQQQGEIDRSFKFPASYTGGASTITDSPTASYYLRMNSDNDGLEWAALSLASATASDDTPVDVSLTAGASGTGADFSRSDHVHKADDGTIAARAIALFNHASV